VERSPQGEIIAAQQSGPGFVLSFELDGGKAAADRFVAGLQLINLAPSLGGFSTLVCTPATMTHRGMALEAQRKAGISPGLLRISVGLEDCDDVIRDLDRGFTALAP
jgi:cystathionine gamma-synthase